VAEVKLGPEGVAAGWSVGVEGVEECFVVLQQLEYGLVFFLAERATVRFVCHRFFPGFAGQAKLPTSVIAEQQWQDPQQLIRHTLQVSRVDGEFAEEGMRYRI
jgi:hypothetical protein